MLENELIVAAAESAMRQAKGTNGNGQEENQDRRQSESNVDLDESNKSEGKGKSEESVIRKVREDLALTQDSDDEYLSDASSIILKKKEAAREAFAKMQKEKEEAKAIKRPLIEEKGQPRETKRRIEQLKKATEDANNTLERIVITEKIKAKWQRDYDRRKKSRINLKMKTAQTEPVKYDDPRDPEMRVNLDKRIEIRTKPKPTEESEEVQQLKKQLAEAQRELKENKILIGSLQDKVEKQAQLILRQSNEARRIVRPAVKDKEEMKDKEAQTVQVEEKDVHTQCESPVDIQVPPYSGIGTANNCTINYHIHYHN